MTPLRLTPSRLPGFCFLAATLLLAGCGPSARSGNYSQPISSVDPGYTAPTAAGEITLAAGTYALTQNAGSISVPVYRNNGSTGAVSVHFATVDGTAIAGTDYTAINGSLSWADGDSSVKAITIPFLNTTTYSGTKAFNVQLSNATGGAVLDNFLATTITVTDNLASPSNSFSFTGWKLTLPVDIYGGTGGINNAQFEAQTIAASTLAAGFNDPFFYLNASNQIVFTTPANGAVTTPGTGSDHTRSELRELYTGTGSDTNGDWNSTRGGTLTATVNVAAVASSSDEATIGQIHGQNQAFVILMFRPSLGDLAVQLYATPTDSSTSARTSILTGVVLNDKITYSINYIGNLLTITVNDVTRNTTKTSTFDVTAWASQAVYFKVGAYHAAPNIGNSSSAQTEVLVSSFAATH